MKKQIYLFILLLKKQRGSLENVNHNNQTNTWLPVNLSPKEKTVFY